MNSRKAINRKRMRRTRRTRAKLEGTADSPRLAVFRSNRGMQAQLIDDHKGHTLVMVSTRNLDKADSKKTKSEQATKLGEVIAEKAKAAGIKKAIFDRRAYAYHGRVRAVAEGARKGGLQI